MHALTVATRTLAVAGVVALAGCGTAGRSALAPYQNQMTTRLWGAAEVPPVPGSGSGTVEANLDATTRLLSWTVSFSGLSGPVTGGHFHGPAIAGENAPVVIAFTGFLTSPIQGVATLTPEQAADFSAGKWYVNLHTAAHPDGEIRGQIPARP